MLKKSFCHLKITDLTFEDLLDKIDEKIKSREKLTVSLLTLKTFVKSIFNEKLRESLNNMDILIPAGKFLYSLVKKTYPNYSFDIQYTKDLITPLIKKYHPFLVNFSFLGGNMPGLNKLGINLKASFSQLKIIGAYPTIYLDNNEPDVKTILKKSEPHVFFLGIGEERELPWLHKNAAETLPKTVSICVNRQIDIMCEKKRDIPYKYKVVNKEFNYILIRKPYRVLDVFILGFVWIKWKLFIRKKKKAQGT